MSPVQTCEIPSSSGGRNFELNSPAICPFWLGRSGNRLRISPQLQETGGWLLHSTNAGFQLCKYLAMLVCFPSITVELGQCKGIMESECFLTNKIRKRLTARKKLGWARGGRLRGEGCFGGGRPLLTRIHCSSFTALDLYGSSMYFAIRWSM